MNTINVILDRRQGNEDYDRLVKEFEVQGVEQYIFWEAIVTEYKPIHSINASHKMIVRAAQKANLEYTIIAEQDCTFTAPSSWKHFLNKMPNKFDIYLWGTYLLPLTENKICGFHLYIISKQFFQRFLDVDDNDHIDTAVCKLGGDYKFCYPFIALQRPGYSANSMAMVNYNAIFNTPEHEHYIYKG